MKRKAFAPKGWLLFMLLLPLPVTAEKPKFTIGVEGEWQNWAIIGKMGEILVERRVAVMVVSSRVTRIGENSMAIEVDWQEKNVGKIPMQPQWEDKYITVSNNWHNFDRLIKPVSGTRGRILPPGEISSVLVIKYLAPLFSYLKDVKVLEKGKNPLLEGTLKDFLWGMGYVHKNEFAFQYLIELQPKFQ